MQDVMTVGAIAGAILGGIVFLGSIVLVGMCQYCEAVRERVEWPLEYVGAGGVIWFALVLGGGLWFVVVPLALLIGGAYFAGRALGRVLDRYEIRRKDEAE